MRQDTFDLLELSERLPNEYFNFILELDNLQQLLIETEYMLEETYEYYRKSIINGRFESLKISDKATKKADEVLGKVLDNTEVMRSIINYMDNQDDGWYFFCLLGQEAIYAMKEGNLIELVDKYGSDKQKEYIRYIDRFLARTSNQEKSKFYKTENGEFELDE